jgi:DNA-binding transcriptional ArsR family regulator
VNRRPLTSSQLPDDSAAGPPEQWRFDQGAARAGLLADPNRLHVLWLLCHHNHEVGALARHTGASTAAISHHLAKLRLAGLVRAHRRGRHKIYTVTDPELSTMIDLLLATTPPPAAPGTSTPHSTITADIDPTA